MKCKPLPVVKRRPLILKNYPFLKNFHEDVVYVDGSQNPPGSGKASRPSVT